MNVNITLPMTITRTALCLDRPLPDKSAEDIKIFLGRAGPVGEVAFVREDERGVLFQRRSGITLPDPPTRLADGRELESAPVRDGPVPRESNTDQTACVDPMVPPFPHRAARN